MTRGEPPKARSQGQLGKYRLVATLGQGGMGTVHLAYASGLGQFRKLLVVKELRQDLVWKDTSVSMFFDEARLAARLDHPNVVQTFEADEDNGRYFIAMEYLDGQPLSALIECAKGNERFSLGLQLHVFCEVLSGLHYAHELRDYDGTSLHVVHRDISPQNVFVTFHGQVKVVDFGVAKARNASTFTSPGVFKGKFAYAAPEQALGRPIDARADVFSVGVMLWEAIAGRRYTDQNPTPEAFQARLSGAEPGIRDVKPDVDPKLADICDRALANEPTQRYKTAAALREDLLAYLHATGQRVDAAQLAALMQQVFQKERVAMNRIVERAMMPDDSGTSEQDTMPPPVMHSAGEKEMTLVADLTGLAEVSHHADENKIRAGYEVSKVMKLKLSTEGAAASEPTRKPPQWLWGALGVSVVAAVASIWIWHSRQSQAELAAAQPAAAAAAPATLPVASAPTVPPPAPATPAAPVPPVEAVVAQPTAAVETVQPAAAAVPADAPAHVAPAAAAPEPGKARVVQARRPAPVSVRAKAAAIAAAPASSAPVQPVAAASHPTPAAKPSEPSMGSDLSTTRRPGARIDVEDPYQ